MGNRDSREQKDKWRKNLIIMHDTFWMLVIYDHSVFLNFRTQQWTLQFCRTTKKIRIELYLKDTLIDYDVKKNVSSYIYLKSIATNGRNKQLC